MLAPPFCILIRCAFSIEAKKDTLEETLKQLGDTNKARAAELEKVQEEVTRLKAEVDKLKEEHRDQIKHVTESASTEITKAKTESEDREKLLRAEIDVLKRENQSLKDTDKLQKEQAETVAQKTESWRALAQKFNEKMEG